MCSLNVCSLCCMLCSALLGLVFGKKWGKKDKLKIIIIYVLGTWYQLVQDDIPGTNKYRMIYLVPVSTGWYTWYK